MEATMEMMDSIKLVFENAFKEQILEIMPCGNHELKRNWVYKIQTERNKYVFKLFEKYNKRIRELNAIPLFHALNPLRIVKYGDTPEGLEWVVYNHIEGWVLEHIIDDLDLDQLRGLFYEIGKKTAVFHNLKTYDYFGDWVKEKQSPVIDYADFIVSDCERLIGNIVKHELPHIEILEDAIQKMRAEYANIRHLEFGRLCHRDLDGRNIMIKVNAEEGLRLEAFLDFEKTVVFNEYFDIIGFYRMYFIDQPKLIEHFFRGYEEILPVSDAFNKEFRFNLYRAGIDICSWAMDVSESFYMETINYLKRLLAMDDDLMEIYAKKS